MNEVKPGPCPACKSERCFVADCLGEQYVECPTVGCMIGPSKATESEAIAAWNAIRARVLREAAELFVERQNELANATDSYGRARFDEIHRARFELAIAADRAERGE